MKYKNYTKLDMDIALKNIRMGRISVCNASKEFKIPQRTLYDRIQKYRRSEYSHRCAEYKLFLEPEIVIKSESPLLIEPEEQQLDELQQLEQQLDVTHENKSELLRAIFLLSLAKSSS